MTHSENLPLHKRRLTISNCSTLDNRMLGCSISGVTPLARLENISYPHISLNGPAFSLTLSQSSLGIWFGDRNPAVLRTLIADCLVRINYLVWLIISQLEQVVTQWNAISLQLLYGWTVYRPVCLFLLRLFRKPSRMSDLCSTVARKVTLKGSMSTEGETLQVSVLPSICSKKSPYAGSVLGVAYPNSEVPEWLMNCSVYQSSHS
jgi:hypothetical protein